MNVQISQPRSDYATSQKSNMNALANSERAMSIHLGELLRSPSLKVGSVQTLGRLVNVKRVGLKVIRTGVIDLQNRCAFSFGFRDRKLISENGNASDRSSVRNLD